MTDTRRSTSYPVPDPAEVKLAESFAGGDAWVLREVYDRYGTQVYRVALASLSNSSDAEEISPSSSTPGGPGVPSTLRRGRWAAG